MTATLAAFYHYATVAIGRSALNYTFWLFTFRDAMVKLLFLVRVSAEG